LRARGGLWLDTGDRKSTSALKRTSDLPAKPIRPSLWPTSTLSPRGLKAAGSTVDFDDAIPGTRRFHTADPAGNRLEFLAES